MEDLGTLDLNSHRIPHPSNGTSHGGLLCQGMVCGDYYCIPQEYRLLLMFPEMTTQSP